MKKLHFSSAAGESDGPTILASAELYDTGLGFVRPFSRIFDT
jgi:hypothetical protein